MLRELAKELHREAVQRFGADGDRVAFLRGLREVQDIEATAARLQRTGDD
jgi:hypothetical protein